MKRIVLTAIACTILGSAVALVAPAQQKPKLYNTAKQKLLDGKQIVGGTILSSDASMYCAMADAGFDFLWIEMQHSPLTYSEVAKMMWACRSSAAIPFIRVPDATEGEIQKATDIGALGIIVPTVDTVEKAEAAVKWTRYPPVGRRSQGQGQYRAMWGADYRQTYNDNVVVVIMIETPVGVDVADKIAAVPGVDVVFAASGDLANFSGYQQGQPQYESLVTRIHGATLKAGRKLGGPYAWKDRPGYSFFQAPGETVILQTGARATLGLPPLAPAVAPAQKK